MRPALRTLAMAMLVASVMPAAWACGYCIEDKVAAVYDYDVVTRALARRHAVAFFALEGTIGSGEASRRALHTMVASIPGVDRASVRVSVESASLSADFDPRQISFASLERSLSRKLAARGLSVAILRIMDQPAEPKPVAKR